MTAKVFGFLLVTLAAQLALSGLSDVGVIHLAGHWGVPVSLAMVRQCVPSP